MNDSNVPEGSGSAAGSAVPQPVEMLVELWWADHFPGSPVAQLTAAWNRAVAAKEDLKRRLALFTRGVA